MEVVLRIDHFGSSVSTTLWLGPKTLQECSCSALFACFRKQSVRRGDWLLRIWFVFLFGAFFMPVTAADELNVAVASNFQPAARELADLFAVQQGHKVVLLAGSTGKHYAQIRNGAPVDVFLAADQARPQRMEKEGKVVAGTRKAYALGVLMLWSADPDLIDSNGFILQQPPSTTRLAIANPKLAPYGLAAQQALQNMNLWLTYRNRIVTGENVAQTFQFVQSGAAAFGFVARSQLAQLAEGQKGSSWEVPRSLYEPIAQEAVIVRDSTAARAWMAYLSSPDAQAIIARYGYLLP
jgi:molybdate transport system substrate-binding protein